MIKNKNYKKISIFIISVLTLLKTTAVFAAQKYVPLEPNAFPGVTSSSGNLSVYLGQIFSFGIAAAVTLALIMIIWGGIEYMTTDSWEGKNDGKERIENALYGLGLALGSYLLLFTINPDLVTFKNNTFLNPPPPSPQSLNSYSQSCGTIGCVDISTIGLTCKYPNSCRLNGTLASKLSSALSGLNAQITQAYPPLPNTSYSSCHQNGTCADVNLLSKSTNPADVKIYYDSMVKNGLSPAYELPMTSSCDQYTNAGIKCINEPTNTAPSFHVNM